MILLTGFYEDVDISRRGEFLECLRRNVVNNRLDEIHLFVEEPLRLDQLLTAYPLLGSAKVRLTAHGRRVTYQHLFAYANRHLPGRHVIIANADMYFDHTLARFDGYDLAGKLLCLSRWHVRPDSSAGFFDHPSSQHAWIFQAPICGFPCNLGVLGCDNRLAWKAEHAGLATSNPSRSLRALARARRTQDPTMRSHLARALMEIRQDLGSEIWDLTAEELLWLLLADFENGSAVAGANAYGDFQPRVTLASNS
jgi:hypothetical protein